MGDDRSSTPPPAESGTGTDAEPGKPGSAAEDLAQGLELMLRAARKAVKNIEPNRLEALGRRAIQGIETLDARRVSQIGRKAVKNLDPRRIEEIAEEAGRELLNVVERVAERVESAVSGGAREDAPPSGGSGGEGGRSGAAGDGSDRPKVRVDDKS